MNDKGKLTQLLKDIDQREEDQSPTCSFILLGLNVEAIIASAYLSCNYGGRNSVGYLF